MGLDASQFINNRGQKTALTLKRIRNILIAVIDSYQAIQKQKIVFNYSQRGSIKPENYLRNRLVDDYLIDELGRIEDGTTHYIVTKDSEEQYESNRDSKNHNDPIDIQIFDSGLDEVWGVRQVYFAMECKRFTSGAVSEYIKDIQKFTTRTYSKLRLPFEGQIGFIERKKLSHQEIIRRIVERLQEPTCLIKTLSWPSFHQLKPGFEASYESTHRKINNEIFKIYHVFLDYTTHVIDSSQ